MTNNLEQKCVEKGIRMTEQRRVIANIIASSDDHPSVEEVYARANKIDPRISIATVYRTVKLLEEENIIEKHDFGDGRARYEQAPDEHHDHIINVRSGEVIEFINHEIEKLQKKIAQEHGLKLVDHRLELYCVPKDE
ncbi:MAG: transcriptional repressor [Alphaproteobacteria bacterium CG11_big_fil_rev_8_21_14_0_20_44_7]|nr:MAG: transcriptional repressor [Alphaproteobacteria bacterium CG11_big_fil_rev_8_21_14_0_20_44_7]